jgi:hypothetical protein
MQSHGWTDSCQKVNLARIAELFLGRGSRCRLNEFSKTSAGIGESPRRQLNPESLKGSKNLVTRGSIHANLSCDGRLQSILSRRHGFLWQIQAFRAAKYIANSTRGAKRGEGKDIDSDPEQANAQSVSAGIRSDFAL